MKTNRIRTIFYCIRLSQKLLMIHLKILFLACIMNTATITVVFSQSKKIDINFEDHPIIMVINYLQRNTGYKFVYRKDILKPQEKVSIKLKGATIQQILDIILKSKGYDYEITDQVVTIKKSLSIPQQTSIPILLKGVVKGADGKPLPGATIKVKGGSLGTATNGNGEYQLKLPDKEEIRLIFSFVGMKNQEIIFSGQKILNVILYEEAAQMEEVVVMGYSTRKINEMTGAIQQFKGQDIASSAIGGNLMNALKGHTTGLQITGSEGKPGKDGELLLRGMGTFFSESTPLFVIDGVITDYSNLSGVVSSTDIEDITILKDAASTAIYGSRAATGVIVVTTKKGGQAKMAVNLNMRLGLNIPNFGGLKYMNSSELLAYGEMTLRNWWNNNVNLQAQYTDCSLFLQDTLKTLRQNFDLTKTTNWKDLMERNGLTKEVALSFRGGGNKNRYYFSYNYFNEQGTKIGYHLTRHLFKTRINWDVTKFLSFGVNLNGTFEENIASNGEDMSNYHPWLTPYNQNGTLKYNIENWKEFVMNPEPKTNVLQDNKYNEFQAELNTNREVSPFFRK